MSNSLRPEIPQVAGYLIAPLYWRPEDSRPLNVRILEDDGSKTYQGLSLVIQESGNARNEPWYMLTWTTGLEVGEAAVALAGYANKRSNPRFYNRADDDTPLASSAGFIEHAKMSGGDYLGVDTDQERVIWANATRREVEEKSEDKFKFVAFMSEQDDHAAVDELVAETVLPEHNDNIEARLRTLHNFFVSHAGMFYPKEREVS